MEYLYPKTLCIQNSLFYVQVHKIRAIIKIRARLTKIRCFQGYQGCHLLGGVKDWHMKTARMMQDFNWLCNLDVNHKLLLTFIIKVVYLCTLHNKILSPAHFVVYVLWWPTLTCFSNINGKIQNFSRG